MKRMITLYLDDKIINIIKKNAKRLKLSMSKLIEKIIKEAKWNI